MNFLFQKFNILLLFSFIFVLSFIFLPANPADAADICCCKGDREGCQMIFDVDSCPNSSWTAHPEATTQEECSALTRSDVVPVEFQAGGPTGGPTWVSEILGGGRELIPLGCRKGKQLGTRPDPNIVGPPAPGQDFATLPPSCGIAEMIQVIVNITQLLLGLIGSFALLMFMYGGFMFLISGGSQEKIQQAKTILRNAVFGIIIVFTAWVIVNFLIIALGQGKIDSFGPGEIFNKRWTEFTGG